MGFSVLTQISQHARCSGLFARLVLQARRDLCAHAHFCAFSKSVRVALGNVARTLALRLCGARARAETFSFSAQNAIVGHGLWHFPC